MCFGLISLRSTLPLCCPADITIVLYVRKIEACRRKRSTYCIDFFLRLRADRFMRMNMEWRDTCPDLSSRSRQHNGRQPLCRVAYRLARQDGG